MDIYQRTRADNLRYTGAITKKKRFYVLWYNIYIDDQSYELNKIINKGVLWFFIRLVLQKSRKLMTMFVLPLLQDTTFYRKNNKVD